MEFNFRLVLYWKQTVFCNFAHPTCWKIFGKWFLAKTTNGVQWSVMSNWYGNKCALEIIIHSSRTTRTLYMNSLHLKSFLISLLPFVYHWTNSRRLFEVWLHFVSHYLQQEVWGFHFRTQQITSTNERAALREILCWFLLILEAMPRAGSLSGKRLNLIGTFVWQMLSKPSL